ncbi:hypothetical protein CUJ83_08510 [Methanocella sp. CWC-04]|uniref:Uncharacterized protein n=1 Tax=Methanooceanicella nereidis TaxID=2052831 RepID=A0AAP2RF28_9EURY|nr:hypothetical protein [Methanocella sp. CWC-04]MCD1295037.1 hypothetical protein [Methanocella sp. CWC-04]
MTDVLVLLEKGDMFGPVLRSYGYNSQPIVPNAFGSQFCPPVKLLIVPAGFPRPNFYSFLRSTLERNKDRIDNFVRNGGIVFSYGALMEEYTYDWLPVNVKYCSDPKKQSVKTINVDSPAAMIFEQGVQGCDGYLKEFDGEKIMASEDDKAVLVHKQLGDGHIIVSGMYDFPGKRFIDWACSPDRKPVKI